MSTKPYFLSTVVSSQPNSFGETPSRYWECSQELPSSQYSFSQPNFSNPSTSQERSQHHACIPICQGPQPPVISVVCENSQKTDEFPIKIAESVANLSYEVKELSEKTTELLKQYEYYFDAAAKEFHAESGKTSALISESLAKVDQSITALPLLFGSVLDEKLMNTRQQLMEECAEYICAKLKSAMEASLEDWGSRQKVATEAAVSDFKSLLDNSCQKYVGEMRSCCERFLQLVVVKNEVDSSVHKMDDCCNDSRSDKLGKCVVKLMKKSSKKFKRLRSSSFGPSERDVLSCLLDGE